MSRPPLDITNQTWNQLTAIRYLRSQVRGDGRSYSLWLFRCSCGNEVEALATLVKRGFKKSCGCHVSHGWEVVAKQVYATGYQDGDLTFSDFVRLSQLPCHYCGASPGNHRRIRANTWSYNGLDRVDATLPHNLSNVVPCCWRHNDEKSDHTYQDYINNIIIQYQHLGLDRFTDGYIWCGNDPF